METKLANLKWPDVEKLLEAPHAVIVPVGSVEQHGRHLPLDVDYICPKYIAEKAAEQVVENHDIRALVAPAIHYGETSTGFQDFPGVIGITIDTAISMFEDIARSFADSGFKKIIFLNGHYSNSGPLSVALRKVYITNRDVSLYGVNWFALGGEVFNKIKKSEFGLHADEMETSAYMVIKPENTQFDKAVKEMPSYSLSERWTKPTSHGKVFFHTLTDYPIRAKGSAGVMGDPTVASKETGEQLLEACIDSLAQLVVEIASL
jgi:creatinine amidohydrolase